MMSRARMSPSFSSQTESMKTTKPTINGSALSARTFKSSGKPTSQVTPRVPGGGPAWSMSPLMEVLPGSPPPVGSSGSSPISPLSSKTCSLKSEGFFSDLPTNASTPRNQDGMENAKEFGRLCLTSLHNIPHKGSCLSKLAMGETAFSEPQHEFLGGQTNSEQESSVYEDFSHMARAEQSANEESDGESPIVGRDKLMDRPKPYHEFLDEVKKQKLRAEVEAWKKAEHMKLMTKLRREEAAIEEWEFKQTSKALKEIKKLENKLEKQRAKAVENTWKTINITKEEAKKKKARARQSTIGRISAVSENQRCNSSTKSLMWHKLTAYCKSMYFKSLRCNAPTSERQRSLK